MELRYQRDVYKLVESLILKNYSDPIDVLKKLARALVDHKELKISGTRLWEFISEDMTYELRMQYGSINRIEDNYKISVKHQSPCVCITFSNNKFPDIFRLNVLNRPSCSLAPNITFVPHLNIEPFPRKNNFKMYLAMGIGPILKTNCGKFYKYLLGFNATEINDFTTDSLQIISNVASKSINEIYYQEERKEIHEDLKLAADTQRKIFPDSTLDFCNYEIYGLCIQSKEIGGDYFDFLQYENQETGEKRLGIIVGDASYKGLSAAIQALFVTGAFRMGWSYSNNVCELFTKVNNLIYRTFEFERLVSLFYCEFTRSSNEIVVYVNAGHCLPFHYLSNINKIVQLEPTGGMLGIFENQNFQMKKIEMHVGNILVIYTDGISESRNKYDEMFGEKRIEEIIFNNKDCTAKEIATLIIEKVQIFSSPSKYCDDKTLVVVKRKQ